MCSPTLSSHSPVPCWCVSLADPNWEPESRDAQVTVFQGQPPGVQSQLGRGLRMDLSGNEQNDEGNL